MIDESTIYWITRLDNIRIFLFVLAFIGTVIAFIGGVAHGATTSRRAFSDEDKLEKKKDLRYSIEAFLVGIFVLFTTAVGLVFTPNTKEMFAIKVIPAIANSERVQSLGADVVDLAKSWIVELGNEDTEQKDFITRDEAFTWLKKYIEESILKLKEDEKSTEGRGPTVFDFDALKDELFTKGYSRQEYAQCSAWWDNFSYWEDEA